MANKPQLDRSIFIPIFIGFISVLGICLVLIAMRLGAGRGAIQSGETTTPVKYQYLATEPGIAFPTEAPPPTSALYTDTPTPTGIIDFPPTRTSTTIASTSIILPNATNTRASASPTALALNVLYDDADFKFNYSGNWNSLSGVNGTYQNTLHISNTIGYSVQLSFVGQKIRFEYQAGPSLGAIAIRLDSVDFSLDQSASETEINGWESPVLVLSSHVVTITHISGGSINIDSIEVIDLSTPTPTPEALNFSIPTTTPTIPIITPTGLNQ
jgi:hypothetical protein